MNTDEKAIREVIGRWHDRTAAGDVEAVLELIAEDAVFLTPGPPIEGRARFETGLRNVLATHRIESAGNIREVVVAGDLAYCVTDLTVRMTPQSGGEAHVRSGRPFDDGRMGRGDCRATRICCLPSRVTALGAIARLGARRPVHPSFALSRAHRCA
jgi:uncharacterized protein (TIGR02246 family)